MYCHSLTLQRPYQMWHLFLDGQNVTFRGSAGGTALKRGKIVPGTDMCHCHHANFHADRREISVPGQKIHIFPYRGLPSIGGYRPILYILESCPAVELILSCNWHATVTLRLTVFDIFIFSRAKIWGIPGVQSPKGIRPTRDRCKLSRWSARDICSRAKKYIFSL